MSKDTALLIIDAQVNMFDEAYSLYRGEAILENLEILLSMARETGIPVVFVQNNGGPGEVDAPSEPGWLIHPALAPREGEAVIQKTTPDSFYETPLKEILDSLRVKRLVIAGMQTDFCINASTRRAAALGYDVILASDAHSTFDSKDKTAAQALAEHNAAFAELATLQPTSEIAF